MLKRPVITLTTDFGLKDPFAGIMKGVILNINPDAVIADLTHNIERHNISEASQSLSMSHRYFPPSTIHIAVVDPGVGSGRRPLLVKAGSSFFIGPDNGVFSGIYNEYKAELTVIHMTSEKYFLPLNGPTFHGRDIFAPAGAWLSKGISIADFGKEITDYTTIQSPVPSISGNTIKGEIISIDVFGNCITNITKDDLAGPNDKQDALFDTIYNNEVLPLSACYAEGESSGLSAIMNSFGQLELFVYKKNAAEQYNIKIGDSVAVKIGQVKQNENIIDR